MFFAGGGEWAQGEGGLGQGDLAGVQELLQDCG